MRNNNIDRIVNLTKDQFHTKITNYLTWQVAKCTIALDKDHREKYSARGRHILKLLLSSRISALNDLDHKPESKYTNNDWAQCMNITNLLLTATRNHTGKSKIPVKVAKAHFNYCCRNYIKSAPKDKQDECLQTIYDLSEWNNKPLAEMQLALKMFNK